MSLNILAVHDQITAKLNELTQNVYETNPPEDSKLAFDANGMMMPYIVVTYTDLDQSAQTNGIIGARYNTGTSNAFVTCVAPTERAARQVANEVRDKLTGFKPSDAGELVLFGGAVDYDGKTNRYLNEVIFRFQVNTAW
jgi:hypothetical protein